MKSGILRKAVWTAALAFTLLVPVASADQSKQQRRIDDALAQRLNSNEAQPVIIRSKPGRHASVKDKLARVTSQYREHPLIGAVSARLTPAQIGAMLNDADVDGVSLDAEVEGSAAAASGDSASLVKQSIGMGDWFTGSTVTVAVIDSGIAPSADFGNRILGMYDFTSGQLGVPSAPADEYGHGTHVAGLIGSSGSSSSGVYAGVAPGVKLLALKVLDKKGSGRTSDVITALNFAVANKAAFGIKVVNLSLGHPIYESAKTDPLVLAVESAVRSGLIVVVAAGNYGCNPATGLTGNAGIASPGNAPDAITVGAAGTGGTVARGDDRLAPFSSRGPSWYDGFAKPDVLAPGEALISNDARGSTLETTYPSLVVTSGTGKYLKLSGSSMASAIVAGMAAIALEANVAGAQQRWQDYQNTLKRAQRTAFVEPPPLTVNALKTMLQFTATRLHDTSGAVYTPLEQGTGLVNALGLVEFAYYTDTTKVAGQYWMTIAGLPYSTVFGGVEETWSQSIIWGTRLLGGDSLINLNQVGWAQNVVWGTGEDDNVVWGTADSRGNVVWSTSDDNVVWGTTIPLSLDLTWSGNTTLGSNVVWGTMADDWDDNVVWGTGLVGYFDGFNVVWGTNSGDEDNVVWGTLDDDNVVWGTSANKVTVLGTATGGGL